MSINITIDAKIQNGLISDLKKFGNNVAKNSANAVMYDLDKIAQSAINEFYSQITPRKYERTEGVMYGFYKPAARNYGNIYRGGIRFTPNDVGEHYKWNSSEIDSPQEVFDRTVIGGYHGPTHPLLKPSPYEKIMHAYDYMISDVENYVSLGVVAAMAESYEYIKF